MSNRSIASTLSVSHRSATTLVAREIGPAPTEHAALETWSAALDLRALQRDFGSCLWIVCAAQLRANLASWTRLAGRADRVCYPVKANPSPAILELLAAAGARAECASPAELLLARLAGFPAERLVYGSPAPDIRAAWQLYREGGTVVVDSREMLEALDQLAADAGSTRGRVLIRVNPSIDIRYRRDESWSELTAHACRTGKFGIASEEVVAAVCALGALRIDGLHAHVGTQMDHAAPFVALAAHLGELAESIEAATSQCIRVLDLGGGLGIPFTESDRFPSIDGLTATLAPQLSRRFEHWFEPGHALVGNAVALLGTITATKSTRGRRWAIADVGTDQLAKITLLNWRHSVLSPDGLALPMTGHDALGGPLCFSGDTLLPSTDVSGLATGDPILVQHVGAYCAALASTFNGRRSGGTVVIQTDGTIARATERAATLDEPLARSHAWGTIAPTGERARDLDAHAIAALTSRVLREDLCAERWEYREACAVGARAYEFTLEIASPVGFVSMPLAIRLAGDTAIVSVLSVLGYETKAFPVWGTALDLRMAQQIRTDRPVRVRIDVSHDATRGSANQKRLAVRFGLWNDTHDAPAAHGSFEIMFDEQGAGC
ncbi:MAG: hypothetical protein RL354_1424 [Planctomycetota bacterium]